MYQFHLENSYGARQYFSLGIFIYFRVRCWYKKSFFLFVLESHWHLPWHTVETEKNSA